MSISLYVQDPKRFSFETVGKSLLLGDPRRRGTQKESVDPGHGTCPRADPSALCSLEHVRFERTTVLGCCKSF